MGAAPNRTNFKESDEEHGKSQTREEDKARLLDRKKPPHNQTDELKKSDEENGVSQPSEEDKAGSLDPKKGKDANLLRHPLSQGPEESQPNEVKPPPRKKPRWQRMSPNTRRVRLLTAMSNREPRLPLYTDHEKQLVDKREVFYALALAAPVGILTAAAGLSVFEGAWASVAGVSAGVWVLAAGGMVLNQYTVLDWERLAARHLGRLGILGAAVLFIFFTYRAFFPEASWALWLLLLVTAIALGVPWILSCVRGDDDVTLASTQSNGDAAGRAPRRRTI